MGSRSQSAGLIATDLVGKVFQLIGKDVRRCLVCDCLFSRQSAARHAGNMCLPAMEILR